VSEYTVTRLEEMEQADAEGRGWAPIRQHFGISSFGISSWTAREAGGRLINEHTEGEDEELYFVHRGRATFELDGERRDAPAGTFVFVPPAVKRTAFAEEPGTTVVAMGAVPGRTFVPLGWELWMPARALYDAGKYGEAADLAAEVADANPGLPGLLYNLACCESLAGRSDAAIGHLREALSGDGARLRELAVTDSDLDPLRDLPAFQEIMG
jgi:mannose-6-phosphate isomerase-like protein (cupin superfamily)